MSLFGYPATVTHYHAGKDDWGRPLPAVPTVMNAKVVEEQKLIRNARGEEIEIAYQVELEGAVEVGFDDYIEYVNAFGQTITIYVRHYEVKKFIGTDDVKEVIVYG